MTHPGERERREYVFGHRQLAAIAFVMVGLTGVAAAIAYMVGRAASPASAMLGGDSAVPARKPIVIEVPVEKPSPSAASPDPVPVAARPANRPSISLSNPVPPGEANQPAAIVAQPTAAGPAAGSHYFQVVSTDRTQADAVLAKLAAAGVSGLIGEGPSPDRVRVFAGPVNDAPTQLELRQKIEAAGFRPFLKKF